MVSQFDRTFKRSGFPGLKKQFSEPIVYYLAALPSRSLDAIIERGPPAFYDAAGNVVLPSFIVRMDNDATSGVLASEVDTGGDEVELIKELGGVTASRTSVLKIISQDSGVTVLALK